MIMQWKYAIMKVLHDSPEPLHYSTIAEEIIRQNLRDRYSATPSITVNVNLWKNQTLFEYIEDGDVSGWRLKDGVNPQEIVEMQRQYAIRATPLEQDIQQNEPVEDQDQADDDQITTQEAIEAVSKTNFVTCWGWMWRRDACKIINNSIQLLGIQNTRELSTYIDLTEQIGVYILYKDSQPIYVGQSKNLSIGRRLYEHSAKTTKWNKWNRFSWFGVYNINPETFKLLIPDGENENYTTDALINGLEGVLIEILETSNAYNIKTGSGMSGSQFFQYTEGKVVEEYYGDNSSQWNL
jgi:hypothetical protein